MSIKTRVLTGICTTGTPHLGNFIGAIKPAIEASHDPNVQPFYFLADYHALIKCKDPKRVQESRLKIAATWMAMGLDTDYAVFYRQSDILEIPELTWLLSCVCAKGLMNRAHAYKAAVDENKDAENLDLDKGITMGLFGYPVLMAADILIFNANKVPVGRDQIQHVEMARDIAGRFNHVYNESYFVLPEAVVDDKIQLLKGLDGRKMSKSYNNTIPLFVDEKKLKKLVFKIKTNSLEPGEPKDSSICTLFQIFSAFSTATESVDLQGQYANGIGWGKVKDQVFEYLNVCLSEPRARYNALMDDPSYIEAVLRKGAERAREEASMTMDRLRAAVGLGRFI